MQARFKRSTPNGAQKIYWILSVNALLRLQAFGKTIIHGFLIYRSFIVEKYNNGFFNLRKINNCKAHSNSEISISLTEGKSFLTISTAKGESARKRDNKSDYIY